MKVWIKCPKCGWIFRREKVKQTKCPRCGKTFLLFPKKGFSRIIGYGWEDVRKGKEFGFKSAYEYERNKKKIRE